MKDILINLLFIVVVTLGTQLFLETRGRNFNRRTRDVSLYISSTAAMIFCMVFATEWNEEFRHDLRAIPFILGGLFGGPVVSVALFVTMLFVRLFYGMGLGFWINVINYGLLLLPVMLIARRFISEGVGQRILLSTSMIIAHAVIGFLLYNTFFNTGLPLSLFLHLGVIKIVVAAFIILFTEEVLHHQRNLKQMEYVAQMEVVSQLSASISHEIRNGLTSTHGFLQLLREREKEPRKLEYIQFALDELIRTENMVRDFLSYSKPKASQRETVRLDRVMEKCISLLEPLANMNSIEIHKQLTPCTIVGDEKWIKQPVINILKNAIEAMTKGGILEVHMECDYKENVIIIKDTGSGMTQAQIGRMGTPYFTTKGQEGTGLGMMGAYRAIKELNGEIKVRSQVGIGTTCSIHLPKKT